MENMFENLQQINKYILVECVLVPRNVFDLYGANFSDRLC